MTIEPGSELAWSRDVLSEYFAIVDSTPEIDRARMRFVAAFGAIPPERRDSADAVRS